MSNDAKIAKIRTALTQLDPTNDHHWTDDGLPREGVVRKLANDQTVSRKDIQEAQPGFQRNPVDPSASAKAAGATETHDPITGEPTEGDPSLNTGEFMSDAEVKEVLEARVQQKIQEVTDAQQNVRDANKRVLDAHAAVLSAKADLARDFPPLTAAENIKQYIASEMAQRAAAHGHPSGLAPGSQIDAAMQRGNSRGWRRQKRTGPAQTGAARPAA